MFVLENTLGHVNEKGNMFARCNWLDIVIVFKTCLSLRLSMR